MRTHTSHATHTQHTPHTHTSGPPPASHTIWRSMSDAIKSNQVQCSNTVSVCLSRKHSFGGSKHAHLLLFAKMVYTKYRLSVNKLKVIKWPHLHTRGLCFHFNEACSLPQSRFDGLSNKLKPLAEHGAVFPSFSSFFLQCVWGAWDGAAGELGLGSWAVCYAQEIDRPQILFNSEVRGHKAVHTSHTNSNSSNISSAFAECQGAGDLHLLSQSTSALCPGASSVDCITGLLVK